jgi:protein-tyrosine phosphatase
MARVAAHDGIEVVCATPHIRHDHDVRIDELPGRIGALQDELDRLQVPVRIAPGGEVAQRAARELSAEHLRAVSLGDGPWVLLEPAPGALADELAVAVQELHARGASVVLAHPERHAGADFEQRLRALAEQGCLIQWTADFLAHADMSDPDGFMPRLVRGGLVHLLATDAHSSHGGRQVRLREAFARLGQACTSARLRWSRDLAPAAILAGEPLAAFP